MLSTCSERVHVDISASHESLVDVTKPELMEDNKDKTDYKEYYIGDRLAE